MASKAEQITTVTIFNQTYKIKSGDDPAYVTELAGFVDHKMNELSRQTPTVDTLKVAILAAMYIADDLYEAKKMIKGYAEEVDDRVQLLLDQLSPLLNDGPERLLQDTEI